VDSRNDSKLKTLREKSGKIAGIGGKNKRDLKRDLNAIHELPTMCEP
jgi:hypothetical protein